MRPLYILNLDYTLGKAASWSLLRQMGVHMKEPEAGDHPILAAAALLHAQGAEVRVWTTCSMAHIHSAKSWLRIQAPWLDLDCLRMRKSSDLLPNHDLKRLWISTLTKGEQSRLVAVFEEVHSTAHMWHKKGITCFQVAPTDL